MNEPRRNQNQNQGQNQNRRRRSKSKAKAKPKAVDLWRPVPRLEDPEPIVPANEPAALLRSLGDPPLQGQGAVAEHYLAAVIERASGLATALAAAAGLLDDPGADDD